MGRSSSSSLQVRQRRRRRRMVRRRRPRAQGVTAADGASRSPTRTKAKVALPPQCSECALSERWRHLVADEGEEEEEGEEGEEGWDDDGHPPSRDELCHRLSGLQFEPRAVELLAVAQAPNAIFAEIHP